MFYLAKVDFGINFCNIEKNGTRESIFRTKCRLQNFETKILEIKKQAKNSLVKFKLINIFKLCFRNKGYPVSYLLLTYPSDPC